MRNPIAPNLSEASPSSRKQPSLSVHGRDGKTPQFEEYVNKVWQEFNWIKTCVSSDHYKQAAIKRNGFRVSNNRDGKSEIIGEWKHDKIGLRFLVITTAQNEADFTWQ